MSETVKVAVRCRPFSQSEQNSTFANVVNIDEQRKEILLTNSKTTQVKQFTFDYAYSQTSKQKDVYEECAYRLVESVTEGYNGTIFAYGQTGTGKTFTMEGDKSSDEFKGIIPRAFEQVFNTIEATSQTQFLVSCTMLELYNEEVYDLLADNGKNKLDVKENVGTGFYVKNLSVHDMKTAKECLSLLEGGSKNRKKASTEMNKDSSRSHSIFSITIERSVTDENGNQLIRKGKLNLVDLAGSEKQSKTKATGIQLEEAKKINLSLVCLGKVISSLVQNSKYIPYRDSKLTKLLSDSLGGNTKTIMIAAIGPACHNYEETLNSLRYANQAKNIQNKPIINEDPKDAKLRQIQEEITKLKEYLSKAMGGGTANSDLFSGELTETMKSQMLKQLADEKEQKEEKNREKIEKIMHMKQISEEERKRLLEEVRRHEEQENQEREEKQRMLEKIASVKDKIVQGRKNKEEYMKIQKELQKKREEQERIQREKIRLQREAEDAEIEKGMLEKKFVSQVEELKEKEDLLKRVKKRYAVIKNEFDEHFETINVQLKSLVEENQDIENTIYLNQLIMESYFDPETVDKLSSAITYSNYDEEFRFTDDCDEETKTLYNTFVNIKFIQEKDYNDVDEVEENFLLFGNTNPFVEFKC